MKVYLVHYWEDIQVVMTKAFAKLPTGEEVRALWVASRGSYRDAEFRIEATGEGHWNVEVFRDGEEDTNFYGTVDLEEVHQAQAVLRVYVCLMWDTGELVGVCTFGALPTGDQVRAAWREIHGCSNEAEFRVSPARLEGCWNVTLHMGDLQDRDCRADIRLREVRA